MEQTKTDPGRKRKTSSQMWHIFACLLILFLGGLTYISRNPRAKMLMSVIYFMQDTLKIRLILPTTLTLWNYARITSMGISHLREKPT